MLWLYLQLLGWLVVSATLVYALAYGGTSERIGALLIFGGSLASFLVVANPQARFQSVEIPMLVVDTIVLVAFICLSLKTKRFCQYGQPAFTALQ